MSLLARLESQLDSFRKSKPDIIDTVKGFNRVHLMLMNMLCSERGIDLQLFEHLEYYVANKGSYRALELTFEAYLANLELIRSR